MKIGTPLEGSFATHVINGYEIEVEWIDYDGDGVRPYCYICKGDYSASWEALEGEECLECEGDFRPVPRATINRIERWLTTQQYFD